MTPRPAPEWQVAEWLNTDRPLGLVDFRGRPLAALAFQLLCPGCAQLAVPQLRRLRDSFAADDLAVVALHSVFEHHAEQGGRALLAAFCHENRLGVPVAIDSAGPSGLPLTFSAYAMQGTPTLLLIDHSGRLRMHKFGHLDDLRLGAALAALIAESKAS